MTIRSRHNRYSLKSALVFSQPSGRACMAATFSDSRSFSARDLSVQSSYMVDRLKSSVCEDRPESTSCSSNARPYLTSAAVIGQHGMPVDRENNETSSTYLLHPAHIQQANGQIHADHLIIGLGPQRLPCQHVSPDHEYHSSKRKEIK